MADLSCQSLISFNRGSEPMLAIILYIFSVGWQLPIRFLEGRRCNLEICRSFLRDCSESWNEDVKVFQKCLQRSSLLLSSIEIHAETAQTLLTLPFLLLGIVCSSSEHL